MLFEEHDRSHQKGRMILKTFEAIGNSFYVEPMQKKLACRGSSNSETVHFRLDRYAGKTDLFECNCTIKTKNSEGKEKRSNNPVIYRKA